MREGLATVNQRSKYLVAQSRGQKAYKEAFKESAIETQRAVHHEFSSLDKKYAELVDEMLTHVEKLRMQAMSQQSYGLELMEKYSGLEKKVKGLPEEVRGLEKAL